MTLAARVALQKAEPALVRLVDELRGKVQAGDPAAGRALCEAVQALAAIAGATAPEATGGMLTTEAMAERLGLSVKSLLRHKKAGTIKPAIERGKLLRWSGRESL